MFGICESRVGETSTFRESLRVAVFFFFTLSTLFISARCYETAERQLCTI